MNALGFHEDHSKRKASRENTSLLHLPPNIDIFARAIKSRNFSFPCLPLTQFTQGASLSYSHSCQTNLYTDCTPRWPLLSHWLGSSDCVKTDWGRTHTLAFQLHQVPSRKWSKCTSGHLHLTELQCMNKWSFCGAIFLFLVCRRIVFKIKSIKKKINLFNEHHTFESDFKLYFIPVAPIWMHTVNTVYVIFL